MIEGTSISDNSASMLIALADLDCSRDVLSALLEMDDVHQDHLRFLAGPVVQQRSPWAETTPEWLLKSVPADRLRIILEEHKRGEVGWQIGPVELTAVMYPATMDAPLCMEYSDIYLWASAQASSRQYGKPLDEIWDSLGGEPVPDKHILEPRGRYHQDYRKICGDVRRRVVSAAKETSRQQRQAEASQPKTEHETEQLALF